MAQRCKYQWQQRYIRGRKERPGEAPVTGTAVHAGAERNFDQKIETFADLPAHELLEWYDDIGFPTVIRLEQEKAGTEILWDTGPDHARARGRKMLAAYHQEVSPRVQPTGAEGQISTDAFQLAVPMTGRYDVERESSVIDLKTGKRKQSTPKEAWRIQAAVYGEARGKPVEFHSVTATESGTVSIVTPLESEALLLQPTPRERAQMSTSIRTVVAELDLCMELYGPDEDWPTTGRFHEWACGYCGFRLGCPAWEE